MIDTNPLVEKSDMCIRLNLNVLAIILLTNILSRPFLV